MPRSDCTETERPVTQLSLDYALERIQAASTKARVAFDLLQAICEIESELTEARRVIAILNSKPKTWSGRLRQRLSKWNG